MVQDVTPHNSPNKEIIINNAIKGLISDLNEKGVSIQAQGNFKPGAVLDLSFVIDKKHIGVKGVIKRISPGIGLGAEFLDILPDDLSCIKTFLNPRVSNLPTQKSPVREILIVDDSVQIRSLYSNKLLEVETGPGKTL